jgi:1-acyl-sn-glycerol-3-phosphate acyltransferase
MSKGIETGEKMVRKKFSRKKIKPRNEKFPYDQVDYGVIKRVLPFLEGLYKYYFRCKVRGLENVPDEGTGLYVGNHNGLITFEVLMLFYAWWSRFGSSRRVLGLAHSIAVDNPLFQWLIPKIGGIPASPEIEAFRPFYERKKIDFFQRKGFIRLALKKNVPIVPIVCAGGQDTYIILDRGEFLAEKLGLKRALRLHGLPITFRSIFFLWCVVSGFVFFVPWLLVPGAFAAIFVPLPVKMEFEVLPPIDPKTLWDDRFSEEENHQRIYNHVIGVMQKRLNEMMAGRKLLPIHSPEVTQ